MRDSFDNIIKTSFENHEERLDVNDIWDKVEKRITTKRKRRVPVWMIFGLIFFAIAALSILFIDFPQFQEQSSLQNNSSYQMIAAEEQVTTNSISQNDDTTVNQSKSQGQILPSSQVSVSKDAGVRRNTSEVVNLPYQYIESTKLNVSDWPISGQSIESAKTITRRMYFINSLPKSEHFPNYEERTIAIPYCFTKQADVEMIKLQIPWNFNLGISAGINVFSSKYNSSQFSSDYLSLRNETESPLEAIESILRLEFSKWNNLSLEIGLEHKRINERFKWSGTYIQDEEGEYLESITWVSPDSMEQNFSTAIIPHLVDRNMEIYNATDLWGIPVGAKYRIRSGKLGLNTFVGVTYYFSSSVGGYVLNESIVPISARSTSFSPGLMFKGEMGLNYKVSEKWHIESRIGYQAMTTSSIISDKDLSKSYHLVGVNIGLTCKM